MRQVSLGLPLEAARRFYPLTRIKERIKSRNFDSDDSDSTISNPADTEKGASNETRRVPTWPCAKWCTFGEDGPYHIDETRVKHQLSQDQLNDHIFMREMMYGLKLHAKVYPLVFENVDAGAPDIVRFRSLSFFRELLASADRDKDFEALSEAHKEILAIGIRDLSIADCSGLLKQEEQDVLRGMIQVVKATSETLDISGMNISFHPSTTYMMPRFVEDLDKKMSSPKAARYAQVMNAPRLFAVFVNPADLSYHNFENIVPMDSWFEWKASLDTTQTMDLSLESMKQERENREIFTCKLAGASSSLLKDLTALDLYTNPLNKATRGGGRFIFHSSTLSNALTKAVRSSKVLDSLADGRLNSSFEFVNYVFRSNRFKPEDAKFSNHRDTPYYDRSRSHVSKYTLLIYLSTGQNDPVLQVDDTSLNEMSEMTCVIFDQRYKHMGQPYREGDKLFLRTELIFKDKNLRHDEAVAAVFSEACYMSGQSIFDEALAAHADACFELANAQRWKVERSIEKPTVYLHKTFQNVEFLTNGNSYWFAKGGAIDARGCAILAVLDYFNCKIGQRPFCLILKSRTVDKHLTGTEQIWELLRARETPSTPNIRRMQSKDLDSLIKQTLDKPFNFQRQLEDWDGEPEELEDFDEDGDGCCLTHSFPMFNPWLNEDIMASYKICCDYSLGKLRKAPILLLGQEIILNESRITISGDKIYILRENDEEGLAPINFAACWSGDEMPPDFVIVGSEIRTPKLLLPPITLTECRQGYQLGLDFFRNDWMVQVDEDVVVPMPDINENLFDGGVEFMSTIEEPIGEMRKLVDYWHNDSDNETV